MIAIQGGHVSKCWQEEWLMACESCKEFCKLRGNPKLPSWTNLSGYKSTGSCYGKYCRPGRSSVILGGQSGHVVRAVLPQDVFTDKPAVVTVGAGDEEEDLPSILHTVQPGLDRIRAGLQVPAWVPFHTGKVSPSILCTEIQTHLEKQLGSKTHNIDGVSWSVTWKQTVSRSYSFWSCQMSAPSNDIL